MSKVEVGGQIFDLERVVYNLINLLIVPCFEFGVNILFWLFGYELEYVGVVGMGGVDVVEVVVPEVRLIGKLVE